MLSQRVEYIEPGHLRERNWSALNSIQSLHWKLESGCDRDHAHQSVQQVWRSLVYQVNATS